MEEADILSGHFAARRTRYDDCTGPILLIQDTTEFSYQRANTSATGITKSVNSGRDKGGRWRHHTVCGMLMHSSLAVTVEGLPLGLAAVKFWTRKKFKGTAQLKKKVNPTRVPIEKKESVRWLDNLRQSIERLGQPERCIHIGDRESDIYELYCLTQELGAHFLVRACVDRLAGDGGHTIATEMEETSVKGVHYIDVRDKGEMTKAALEIGRPAIPTCGVAFRARLYACRKCSSATRWAAVFLLQGKRSDLLKVIWHDGRGACLFTKKAQEREVYWAIGCWSIGNDLSGAVELSVVRDRLAQP